MGIQFWWFYDVIAVAIVLVCVFLSSRKGTMKAAITTVGYGLALALALGISSSSAESLYKNTMRSSSINNINHTLKADTFINKYASYLESIDSTIRVNPDKLGNIFEDSRTIDADLLDYLNNINGRKLGDDSETLDLIHEGYAVVIRDIVSQNMSKYAAETAAREIRNNSKGMQELIPMIINKDDRTPAAKYIADNYTAPAYITVYKLIGFLILFAVIAVIMILILNQYMSKDENKVDVGSHISGGIIGVIKGGLFVTVAAALIRIWAILGSDEMLFFNNTVIDKSFVFKYFYTFVSSL
ncbi:MAG: hypothetical protein IKP42_07395 [Ruminococcus sp.]|nr:hypothetical protein [Ruminococcus sp.]